MTGRETADVRQLEGPPRAQHRRCGRRPDGQASPPRTHGQTSQKIEVCCFIVVTFLRLKKLILYRKQWWKRAEIEHSGGAGR